MARLGRWRAVIWAALATMPLSLAVLTPHAASQVRAADVSLQDTLEKGLKARLPADFEFVAHVVQLVDNGTLPYDLVLGTFDWVRKNRGQKTYLMPYFEQALRRRAAERGIQI